MISSLPLQIHIPKTGGTSIAEALFKKEIGQHWIRPGFGRHDTYIELTKVNDITDAFVFSVVRNPYTRAYSYYHHFCFVNNVVVSFKEFLTFVKEKKFFPKTPMIVFDQTHYLLNVDRKIAVDKLYRFENLDLFKQDFECKLNHTKVGNYSKRRYYEDYTEELQELVLDIYQRDFVMLNYSIEFKAEESLYAGK